MNVSGYITEHPILEFKRGRKVKFYFEGKELEGYEGLPIAAALHASGIRVLRYSEKYSRPRGFFCAVGKCSSCLMEVDGRPNVMVCMEPLKQGMRVKRQKGKGHL
ncbi:MAG: (2Fe-2S)-binding protein [candidate division WOR-3 bacterium]